MSPSNQGRVFSILSSQPNTSEQITGRNLSEVGCSADSNIENIPSLSCRCSSDFRTRQEENQDHGRVRDSCYSFPGQDTNNEPLASTLRDIEVGSIDTILETDRLVSYEEEHNDVQPYVVVSRYISPHSSPLPHSPIEPNSRDSDNTPSSTRHLSISPSAASLWATDSQIQMPSPNNVVRSASAYAYTNLHLPIPLRSPGLSPVTRISFSTDLGSSLASFVLTPFGGSHVTDTSSTFGSSDGRLDGPPRSSDENALRLQGGASGLLVSLTNLANVHGPPLYSPPPTYEQVNYFTEKITYKQPLNADF